MEEESNERGEEGEHGDDAEEENRDDNFVDVVVTAGVVRSVLLAEDKEEDCCEPS